MKLQMRVTAIKKQLNVVILEIFLYIRFQETN